MRLASFGIVALLLMTEAAFGGTADQSECPNVAIVKAVLQKHFPGIELRFFKGDHARRFVDAYNSSLASSQWPATEVLIARNPQTPDRARIGFFKDGCLLALVARSRWIVDSLERSLVSEQDT